MPELEKLGGQNTPYKLGLNPEINFREFCWLLDDQL